MRYILLFIIFGITVGTFTSCKIGRLEHYSSIPPINSPFIQLNDGTKITVKHCYYIPASKKDTMAKIETDTKTYNVEEVHSYTGHHFFGKKLYLNVINPENLRHAELVNKGKINVYRGEPGATTYSPGYEYNSFTHSYSYGTVASHSPSKYYIQKSDTGKWLPFTNQNTQELIPKTSPAYNKLFLSKQGKRRKRLIIAGYLASFAAGIAMPEGEQETLDILSGVLIATGLIGIFSIPLLSLRNHPGPRAMRAIKAYNDEKP
ncbi:MAG: hypothetical protein EBX41_01350 [Chitinophagia bacterium]|nr:hypothetical protein [Chitinophagia bacterium]